MKEDIKILLYDLEVSREVVAGYGNKYKFNVVKTVKPQELMCFAYKFLGDKKVKYVSIHDKGMIPKPQSKQKLAMAQELFNILDQADVVVAHNANRFDNKMANRFFLEAGLAPPSPYKTIDTLQVARGAFKFSSNSLNSLGEQLGLGSKKSITYADLEDEFMGDKCSNKTKRLMKEYNIQDVVLLEKLYIKMLPFIKNHPNLGDITRMHNVCPRCGKNKLTKRGFQRTVTGDRQRYQCISCGGWCSESSIKNKGRIVSQ